MSDQLSGFYNLHKLASNFGDGLKPELLELAQRSQKQIEQGVLHLPMTPKAAVPRHQFATSDELREAKIPVLRAARQASAKPKANREAS